MKKIPRYSYFILVLAALAGCSSQTSVQTSKKLQTVQKKTIVQKTLTSTVTKPVKREPVGEYFRENIGNPAKNDNTISYGSIVSAKPEGFKVSKEYFPSVAQNFRQRYLILHYTSINDEVSLRALTKNDVSSHYLINSYDDKDIYQLVDENKRAYHAGVSGWRGDKNINDSSIGIEIVNLGFTVDASGQRVFQPYPEYQYKKIAALVKDIVTRYQIKPQNVLGHSDIAPTRKQDPGPLFPWKRLYDEHQIGMWYDKADVDAFMNQLASTGTWTTDYATPAFIMRVQLDLQKFGYDIPSSGLWDDVTQKTIQAFQYHFRPEKGDGVLDMETYAILLALMKKYPR